MSVNGIDEEIRRAESICRDRGVQEWEVYDFCASQHFQSFGIGSNVNGADKSLITFVCIYFLSNAGSLLRGKISFMNSINRLTMATVGAMTIAFGTTCEAQAAIFNTSDSQFDSGIDNQGWWSDTPRAGASDSNANYIVGNFAGGDYRNFFTFDLSSLRGTVTSARLELLRYSGQGDPTETLGLFDVSTDAATLNNNGSPSAAIFNDLGSGTSYGTFEVSTFADSSEILSFDLNSAAIADINAARGGFFSVGGSLLSGSNDQNLFSFSGRGSVQRLVAVPEPSSALGTLALGALGGGYMLKRQLKKRGKPT